ncbi:sensor histidine kinase [Nocardioides ferulae]|uniref:sensor histidine kinase n=1 Tax=Nocardioides ferulae TaxID=2340821 RepID=UPI000EAC1701|nr:HAMP domain-containing sensor histidine kinase [Nocardioides ferulae]
MSVAGAAAAPEGGGLFAARVDAWLPEEWSRRALREQLQVIAEAVREVAGFGVVAIGVFLETEELELMAVAGSDQARAELLGDTAPAGYIHTILAQAEDWGRLRFLPHAEAVTWSDKIWIDAAPEAYLEEPASADAWRPYDVLMAPVTNDAGDVIGVLSFDQPADGVRPGPAARERVGPYIDRAAAAIRTALERDQRAEHVRLTDAVRRVVRTATTRMPLDQLLLEVTDALRDAFEVELARITTLQTPFSPSRTVTSPPVLDNSAGPQRDLLLELAERCWDAHRVAVISEHRTSPGLLSPDEHRRILERSLERGLGSLVLMPIGAAGNCLGWALLGRVDTSLEWNDQQAAAALDIGHDLGRAVLQAQRLEQDSALTAELRAASEAKSRLISTVAHELKNPLGAVLGYAEVLAETDHGPAFATSLRGIQRSAARMQRMVEELLVLSRLDERALVSSPVDLGELVDAAVARYAPLAAEREVSLSAARPADPVRVLGSAVDLQHLVDALVENAVTYSAAGGTVRLSVERHGDDAVLTCADRGYGIPPGDLEEVFTEFYRSTNARALAHPGTGLGLAIAARVTRAHGGRIEVDSTLEVGSTFRVHLPAAP